MNEKIKELAEQATVYKEGIVEGKHDIEVFDKEKFAELIARKCANICEDLSFSPEGPSHEAKYQRNLCALAICDAFGVPSEFRK